MFYRVIFTFSCLSDRFRYPHTHSADENVGLSPGTNPSGRREGYLGFFSRLHRQTLVLNECSWQPGHRSPGVMSVALDLLGFSLLGSAPSHSTGHQWLPLNGANNAFSQLDVNFFLESQKYLPDVWKPVPHGLTPMGRYFRGMWSPAGLGSICLV